MNRIRQYLSLIKFSHTLFAMPFALIGFGLGLLHLMQTAEGPEALLSRLLLRTLPLVILCMVFARSAAMAFNRYLDRHIDAKNIRTATREIPQGMIRPQHALIFTWVNAILFIGTTYLIYPVCFYLSPVALAVILGYSYTKRFTALCHLVLGLGLSLAPVGAYLAVTGHFSVAPIWFSVLVLCWVSGFDIIYALQDASFDREQQLHSIPARLGLRRALWVSRGLHLTATIILCVIGWQFLPSAWYLAGALVFAGLLFYQQSLVSEKDLSRVNLAFMTSNGVASLVFAAFTLLAIYHQIPQS